jgi:hypothetical protein
MARFPSTEWFDAVRAVFNSDDSFQGGGGGACNALMGAKIGGRFFLVTFEGAECSAAREVQEAELAAADFILEMPFADWKEMVENIAQNGHADLHHTLNTLDLGRPDGLSHSVHGDQYREDLFFRYNQTMQYFFDASARVATEFSE